MIKVIESVRKYCTACCGRELENAYEIRFGNPKVNNVTVMTICSACLSEIQRQSMEVNPID